MEYNLLLIICIICIICIILYLFYKKNFEYFNTNQNNKTIFICNHYKFKSDEEYQKRLIEYNKGGHMDGKLSQKKRTEKWKKKSSVINNYDIMKYKDELKKHMKEPLHKNKKKNTIYNISVVVMFRYEDDYLEEWLYYYIMHGIEHFFLYSNKNTENTIKILKPFIDKGYITLIDWNDKELLRIPKNKRRLKDGSIVGWNKICLQNLAFIDFVKNYKHKTKWIIKVDIDEFIYPKNTKLKIKDVLDKLDSSTKIIYVPRIDFGNNGHKYKPKGLIIENYTKSALSPSSSKPIALTKFISNNDEGGAHYFKMV